MTRLMVDLPTTRRISFLQGRKRKPETATVLGSTPVAVPVLDVGDLRIVATRPRIFPGDTYADLAHVEGSGLFFRSEVFPDVASLSRGVADGPALRTSYPLLFASPKDLPPIVEAVAEAELDATHGPFRIVDDGAETAPLWASAIEQAFVVHDGTVWQKLGVPPLLALIPDGGSPMLGTFFGFGGKHHPGASLFGLHEMEKAEGFAASLGMGPVRRSADVYEILDAGVLDAHTPSSETLAADRIRKSSTAFARLSRLHSSMRRTGVASEVEVAVAKLCAPYLLKDGELLDAVELVGTSEWSHGSDGAIFAAAMAPHLARRRLGQTEAALETEIDGSAFATGL